MSAKKFDISSSWMKYQVWTTGRRKHKYLTTGTSKWQFIYHRSKMDWSDCTGKTNVLSKWLPQIQSGPAWLYWKNNCAIQMRVYLPQIQSGLAWLYWKNNRAIHMTVYLPQIQSGLAWLYWKNNCALQMSLSNTDRKWTGLSYWKNCAIQMTVYLPQIQSGLAWLYWKNNCAIQMTVYLPQIQSGLAWLYWINNCVIHMTVYLPQIQSGLAWLYWKNNCAIQMTVYPTQIQSGLDWLYWQNNCATFIQYNMVSGILTFDAWPRQLPKQVCCKNWGCKTSWIPLQSYTSTKYIMWNRNLMKVKIKKLDG